MSGTSEHRWSARTVKILRKAGWYPGRVAEPENAIWGSGGEIRPPVSSFLNEFGGLQVRFPWCLVIGITISAYDVVFCPPPLAGAKELKPLEKDDLLYSISAAKPLIGSFGVVGEVPTGDVFYLMDEVGRLYECGLRVPGGPPLDLYRLGDSMEESMENLCTGRIRKQRVKLADRSEFDRLFKELGYEVNPNL